MIEFVLHTFDPQPDFKDAVKTARDILKTGDRVLVTYLKTTASSEYRGDQTLNYIHYFQASEE